MTRCSIRPRHGVLLHDEDGYLVVRSWGIAVLWCSEECFLRDTKSAARIRAPIAPAAAALSLLAASEDENTPWRRIHRFIFSECIFIYSISLFILIFRPLFSPWIPNSSGKSLIYKLYSRLERKIEIFQCKMLI